MKNLFVSAGCVLFLLSMTAATAAADEEHRIHSVGPRGFLFFPNNDSSGLNGYGTGVGAGVDVRFTIARTNVLAVQVGPVMEFAVTGSNTAAPQGVTGLSGGETRSTFFSMKQGGDLVIVFPINPIELFIGGGILTNYALLFETTRNYPAEPDLDIFSSGVGVGAEATAGINIRAGNRGSVTVGLTYPIGQRQRMDYTIYDHATSDKLATSTSTINVGGAELYAGYRLNFSLPYSTPEPPAGPGQ